MDISLRERSGEYSVLCSKGLVPHCLLVVGHLLGERALLGRCQGMPIRSICIEVCHPEEPYYFIDMH